MIGSSGHRVITSARTSVQAKSSETKPRINVELDIRQIIVDTTGLPAVDHVFSYTEIPTQEDDNAFFWRQVESKYDIVVTRSQRANLRTCGEVIRYLKLRLNAEVSL